MTSFIAAFFIAALVVLVLTPYVRQAALRRGLVATTGHRHVHTESVPRIGGLAIAAAIFAPIVGLFFVESTVATLVQSESQKVMGLCLGGAVLCLVGFIDDTRGLSVWPKLLAQVLVAMFAFYCGFRIESVLLPFVGAIPMGDAALLVTVLWIVGITNAVNLLDGLDGLAAGVVFFAGISNLVVALVAGAAFSALVMSALLGAVAGFLFYNFNPARIFMGDSGSYLLGYVMAVTALVGDSSKGSTAVALLVPIVALGEPIFDTVFSVVRRYLDRRPVLSPDRGHLHHRLLDRGLTQRRAVLSLYGITVLFTVSAIAIYIGRRWQVGVALLIVSLGVLAMVRLMSGRIGMRESPRASYGELNDPSVRVSDERRAMAEYALRERALQRLGAAFAAADIPAMLVKGAGLAQTVYPKPWLREMGDIDILVLRQDRGRAIDALVAADCELLGSDRGRRISAEAAGTRQLVVRVGQLGWEIDLHTRLDKVVGRNIDYEAVFERAAPIEDPALNGFVVPSIEDHVLFLVIHAAAAEFDHAATWGDLELLLARDLDHDLLLQRARRWHLTTSLHVVLRTLQVLDSEHVPAGLIEQSAPTWLRRKLLGRLYRIGQFPVTLAPRELGWRWIVRQLPLRDDALRWCLGVMVYGFRRMADRVSP